MSQTIPGPKGSPFLGHVRELVADAPGFTNQLADTYGPLVRFKAFSNNFNLVADPDLAREVLVTQVANFPKDDRDVELLDRMIGHGLVTANGEEHKRLRRLSQPAFHSKRIEGYAGTMVDYTSAMLDDWRGREQLDISEAMRELTMYIVCRTLFGADRVTMRETAERVGAAIHTMQEITNKEFQSAFVWPVWIPTAMNRRRREAQDVLFETIERIVAERQSAGDQGDLLSMLLLSEDESGDRMSEREVRNQLVTFFVAGHETTSNALTWTWYLLSQHPDVEARLHEEVDTALGGRPPALDDLPRLPYTLQVIKEAMRLYPPAWTINIRRVAADTMLGDFSLRSGELLWLSPYVLHRRPQYFPDPERFDPDRFTPEKEKALPKYGYLPFGGGPRVCIGNHFALMEAHLIVATVARCFRLRLAADQTIELNPQVTLSNVGGMRMVVQDRH